MSIEIAVIVRRQKYTPLSTDTLIYKKLQQLFEQYRKTRS